MDLIDFGLVDFRFNNLLDPEGHRSWYHLVSRLLFTVSLGLFVASGNYYGFCISLVLECWAIFLF